MPAGIYRGGVVQKGVERRARQLVEVQQLARRRVPRVGGRLRAQPLHDGALTLQFHLGSLLLVRLVELAVLVGGFGCSSMMMVIAMRVLVVATGGGAAGGVRAGRAEAVEVQCARERLQRRAQQRRRGSRHRAARHRGRRGASRRVEELAVRLLLLLLGRAHARAHLGHILRLFPLQALVRLRLRDRLRGRRQQHRRREAQLGGLRLMIDLRRQRRRHGGAGLVLHRRRLR
mmetsp:Transcript_149/g.467  ORF Transcript_149/g.467 Transcript_149/m.467 type:complete len:231 (+) Transcript_149:1680-2372(+)